MDLATTLFMAAAIVFLLVENRAQWRTIRDLSEDIANLSVDTEK